jgi:hypothetical protein
VLRLLLSEVVFGSEVLNRGSETPGELWIGARLGLDRHTLPPVLKDQIHPDLRRGAIPPASDLRSTSRASSRSPIARGCSVPDENCTAALQERRH